MEGWNSKLRLFNSLTGLVEEVGALRRLRWYACGPTVYDAAHLGHARTYVTFDAMRRVLTGYFGYQVDYCMNITDVDDKIIGKAAELDSNAELQKKIGDVIGAVSCEDPAMKNVLNVTRYYEALFWADMEALRVKAPTHVTRVSEYMTEIVGYVGKLVDAGRAYVSNGSVYFDVARHGEAHQYPLMCSHGEAEGERGEKRDARDFALWKKASAPCWPAPWGPGRPGWHIECSAMCECVFGDTIDIHSGGIDLKFPHHSNEVAQSEAYLDVRYGGGAKEANATNTVTSETLPIWCKTFVHTGHLHIAGQKMSKSLKNFVTIEEALAGRSANAVRLLFLNQPWGAVQALGGVGAFAEAEAIDARFAGLFAEERSRKGSPTAPLRGSSLPRALADTERTVYEHLCNNLDFQGALRALQSLTNAVFAATDAPLLDVQNCTNYIRRILELLGVEYAENVDMAPVVETACQFRASIRLVAKEGLNGDVDAYKKILKICDEFRDTDMLACGIQIKDTTEGFTWQPFVKREEAEAASTPVAAAPAKPPADLDPAEYFKWGGKFETFTDEGFPLTKIGGEPVSKKEAKKLQTLWDKHKKAYDTR